MLSRASAGPFDLIAISPHSIELCQVKANKWPGSGEMMAMAAVEVPDNSKKRVHRWKDYAREPDVREVEPDGDYL